MIHSRGFWEDCDICMVNTTIHLQPHPIFLRLIKLLVFTLYVMKQTLARILTVVATLCMQPMSAKLWLDKDVASWKRYNIANSTLGITGS